MAECFIFDIDGTLADCAHRIHHITGDKKEWAAFFTLCAADAPIPHVVRLAVTLFDADQQIVYVSGRSDECRAQTLTWLAQFGLPEAPLYMRKAGDHRNDDIVKSELMDALLADGLKPIMVFEDRARVVKMWRARGVPCAQVAEGDF